MPKYLVRRRNQFGQYIHLTTLDFEPTDEQINSYFGPGEYSVLIAREGIIGLAAVRNTTIPWEMDLVGWVLGIPTTDYIRDNYGEGNYYVLTNCTAVPLQVFPQAQPHDLAWQNLQDGATATRNISTIFRVKMPWI